MSRILKAQLKKVKNLEGRINPDQAWVARTKTSLLQTIASETIVATTPVRAMVGKKRAEQMLQGFQAFFPKNIFSQARPVFISLLVFLLAGSGWIASASASGSLPGDTLWQIPFLISVPLFHQSVPLLKYSQNLPASPHF